MRKRLRKKKHPVEWGSIALCSTDDVRNLPFVPPGPDAKVGVVVWRTVGDLRRNTRSKRGLAVFKENGLDWQRGTLRFAGELHFALGCCGPGVIAHEAAHASAYAERLIGSHDEERFCYRTERLVDAIVEYVDKVREKASRLAPCRGKRR